MTKKVFNLSIKELKSLLTLTDKKKKRRRRKNKKTINKIGGIRSTSEHMMIPTNVSSLQSENIRLLNQQLENKIEKEKTIKPEENQIVVKQDDELKQIRDRLNKTDENINNINSFGSKLYKDYYKSTGLSNIPSQSMNASNVLRTDVDTDNIDVTTTQGSDDFNNYRTSAEEQAALNETAQAAAQSTPMNVDEIPSPTDISDVYKSKTDFSGINPMYKDKPDQRKSERINNQQKEKVEPEQNLNLLKALETYKNYNSILRKNPDDKILNITNISTVKAMNRILKQKIMKKKEVKTTAKVKSKITPIPNFTDVPSQPPTPTEQEEVIDFTSNLKSNN